MDGLEEEEAENHVKKVAAGGSSAKALDPCLETGEVGEGPARPAKIETKKSRQNKLGNSSEHEDKKKTLLIILEGSLNKCRLPCPILDRKEATKEVKNPLKRS